MSTIKPYYPSMEKARAVAGRKGLRDLFDAYEIFCSSYGLLPESWKFLSAQLSSHLESTIVYSEKSVPPVFSLRSEISFTTYLEQLQIDQVAYLTSDVITEIFLINEVLRSAEYITRNTETPYVEVRSWFNVRRSDSRFFVRECYSLLSKVDVYLMMDGIAKELYARATGAGPRGYFERIQDSSWSPCSDSHYDILLCLDIELSPKLLKVVEEKVGYQQSGLKAKPSPNLLDRAVSRAGRILRSPKPNQDSGSVLQVIDEDSVPIASAEEEDDVPSLDLLDLDKHQSKRNTKRSSYSDYRSFVTAFTHITKSSERRSFATARTDRSAFTHGTTDERSTTQSFLSWSADMSADNDPSETQVLSDWRKILNRRAIVPDPELENWSDGRGQHAEYQSEERVLIPLEFETNIGSGGTAVVASVLCKRVRLVRKVIICSKKTRINRDDALQEVQQLYRAQHSHIVRLVGTYVIDSELAILTYPRAEWNLEEFMNIIPTNFTEQQRSQALCRFFTCLIRVLDFIHSFPIKHMDIKPQNLLVRDIRNSSIKDPSDFKIYLTDFGSSRLYPSVEDTETDTWTPFTRAYAAKEVVLQETRGLSADVFSMGCVFAEMFATAVEGLNFEQPPLSGRLTYRESLMLARSGNDGKPKPYHSKLASVCKWLGEILIYQDQPDLVYLRIWIFKMLDNNPATRPTARQIVEDPFLPSACASCTLYPGPEDFEAAKPLSDTLVSNMI